MCIRDRPQDVRRAVATGAIADFAERIDQRQKFRRQLREHAAEHALATARQAISERRVGTSAHCYVIVDVNQLGGEAMREAAGDE